LLAIDAGLTTNPEETAITKHIKMVVRRAFAAAYSVFFDLFELPLNMQQKFFKNSTKVFSCVRTKLEGENKISKLHF